MLYYCKDARNGIFFHVIDLKKIEINPVSINLINVIQH